MSVHPPVLSTRGYRLDADALWIIQKDGWVSVPLGEVVELKKPSLTSVIIRLADGKKKTLVLSQLSTKSYAVVIEALKSAAQAWRTAAGNRSK